MERDEFMFFLTGGVGLENKIPNPDPTWLSEKSWDEICRFADMPKLGPFRKSFQDNVDKWRQYYDEKAPHLAELPEPWDKKLTDFQKMIVLRCLRPDKVSIPHF